MKNQAHVAILIITSARRLSEQLFRTCMASLIGLALASVTLAVCGVDRAPENYSKSIVTYYQTTQATTPFDSRCSYVSFPGTGVLCRISLRGVLYRPLTASPDASGRYPAIIMNHGSGALFPAISMFCEIANYFAPRGYIVFVPFRRGQGDQNRIQDRSTGVYVDDLIQDWQSANPIYPHTTQCTDGKCYRVELFKEQADEDVAAALEYLKGRSDVKYDWHWENGVVIDRYNIGVFGNSYGGAVTVLFNRLQHDHLAAVAFSPGSQQFADLSCQPYDVTCQTPMQKALMDAARNAKKPAYYLQAKWDFDTRPTIDLAWAHAYGSPDPSHSRGWAAQIFPYTNPCIDGVCDYQSIHEGFIRDPAVWGNSVHDFLRRRGVK